MTYPYLQKDDAARTAVDVFILLLMIGPLVALLISWGVPWIKRRYVRDTSTPRAIDLHDLTSSWALRSASSRLARSRSRPRSPARGPQPSTEPAPGEVHEQTATSGGSE